MLVLDASIAVAWLVQKESADGGLAVLDRVGTSWAVVPAHWWLEVGQGLLVAQRRDRLQQTAPQLLAWLRALPIRIDADSAARAANETLELALKYELSSQDAAYLELALRRELPLATLDKALARAAQSAGIALTSMRV